MTGTRWWLALLLLVALAPAEAAAQGPSRQDFKQFFSTPQPGASAGVTTQISTGTPITRTRSRHSDALGLPGQRPLGLSRAVPVRRRRGAVGHALLRCTRDLAELPGPRQRHRRVPP